MKRRCFNCKKLEEESTVKFYKRTKLNPDAVFLCKRCIKARKNTPLHPREIYETDEIESFMKDQSIHAEIEEKSIKSIYNYNNRLKRLKRIKIEKCEGLSREERFEIGKFYRSCPAGYEVDHILPVSKGGKHELKNLQYLSVEENRRKHAKTSKSDIPPLTTVFRGM